MNIDFDNNLKQILRDPEDCYYPIANRLYLKRYGDTYHLCLKSEAPMGGGWLVIPELEVEAVAKALAFMAENVKAIRRAEEAAKRAEREKAMRVMEVEEVPDKKKK